MKLNWNLLRGEVVQTKKPFWKGVWIVFEMKYLQLT